MLPKYTEINTYAINLEEDKQRFYRLIYSLGLVRLEILRIYIKTNFGNSFICSLKSLTGALILFDKKPDKSFLLWVNYQSLNNITIKNWYPFPLVGEFLNYLDCAKQFT